MKPIVIAKTLLVAAMLMGLIGKSQAVQENSGKAERQIILLTPVGDVAANLPVYIVGKRGVVHVEGEFVASFNSNHVAVLRTDSRGQLQLPSPERGKNIVVADRRGYLDEPLEKLTTTESIRLRSWSRIEGRLVVGSAPGAHQKVGFGTAPLPYAYYPRGASGLWMRGETVTDDKGGFCLTNVPSVAVEVFHLVKVLDGRDDSYAESQRTKVIPQEGKTTGVTFGGSGRLVRGKVILNGYDASFDWRKDFQFLEPVPNYPQEFERLMMLVREHETALGQEVSDGESPSPASLSREAELLKEIEQFYRSESGQKLYLRQQYALNFNQDGSFRCEDVPNGKYSLNLVLTERSPLAGVPRSVLAQTREVVDVPHDLQKDAYDLGQFSISPKFTALRIGAPAPDFDVQRLGEGRLKLSDYRGKFVLLEFWATWCPPCLEEVPRLKNVYEKFKDDPQFVMMSLSLDDEPEAPKKYVRENGLGWLQGHLGEWPPGAVCKAYSIEGIPAFFLIGPDGIVVGNRLRGDRIQHALNAVLR